MRRQRARRRRSTRARRDHWNWQKAEPQRHGPKTGSRVRTRPVNRYRVQEAGNRAEEKRKWKEQRHKRHPAFQAGRAYGSRWVAKKHRLIGELQEKHSYWYRKREQTNLNRPGLTPRQEKARLLRRHFINGVLWALEDAIHRRQTRRAKVGQP